jgi:hypothetical protein
MPESGVFAARDIDKIHLGVCVILSPRGGQGRTHGVKGVCLSPQAPLVFPQKKTTLAKKKDNHIKISET